MYENLQASLMGFGLTVETVSRKLGVTRQYRDDGKILQHAKENGTAVVTDDKRFMDRLKASNIRVVTVGTADKTRAIRARVVDDSA